MGMHQVLLPSPFTGRFRSNDSGALLEQCVDFFGRLIQGFLRSLLISKHALECIVDRIVHVTPLGMGHTGLGSLELLEENIKIGW